MNTLIIYDSLYGNTKIIAEAIFNALKLNTSSKLIYIKDFDLKDLKDIDLLIVGSPTHGGWYSEDTKSFLNSLSKNALKNILVATFDTSTPQEGYNIFVKFLIKLFGNASPRILKALKNKGASPLKSEIFWVLGKKGPLKEGEEKRATLWAEKLFIEASSKL